MITAMKFWIVVGIVGILVSPLAGKADNSATGMTVITSNELSYDYKRSIAVFEDNVVVEDPQVRIESDTLTVLFGKTNELKSATALGNVRISSGDKRATCRKAIYIASTGEILLNGDAQLFRRNDSLSGDQITFWINEERVLCKPGRLVIFPDKERSRDDTLEKRFGAGK